MQKGTALYTDFLLQGILTGIIILTGFIMGRYGMWWTLGICTFLVLLVYQFFSGVYLAAEYKLFYRGLLPAALLVLVTVSILFAAFNLRMGVFFALYLTPVLSLGNLVFSAFDWLKSKKEHTNLDWNTRHEHILDSKEVFK